MKAAGICFKWLFILCLPILLLTISISWAANSLWLYEYGFHKYDVGSTAGLTDSQLENIAVGLISYFNSHEEYISITVTKNGESSRLFNQREVIHLRDVKELIRLNYWVLLGTLVYVLGYAVGSLFWQKRRHWQQLAGGLVGGSSITLALMLALGLGALLGFDQLFLQFHLLSFTNDFWQLDPSKDYLIMLFPEGFFYDASLFCALATTVWAIALLGMAGWYLLFTKRRTLPREGR